MLLSGRPLQARHADAKLFVGESLVDQIMEPLNYGMNVIVAGRRGSGKTSLLNMAFLSVGSDSAYRFIRASAAGCKTPSQLAARVVIAAGATGVLNSLASEESMGKRRAVDLVGDLRKWANKAQAGLEPVFVLEDVPGSVAGEFFGTHRDSLWAIGVPWVVTVEDYALQQLMSGGAEAFFEATVHLSPLSDDQAFELLRRRAPELSDQFLQGVVAGGEGNPRRLISAARDLTMDQQTTPREWANTVEAGRKVQQARLAQLGRSASMAYIELESLGSASASDEAFLTRMGWTRARASQVLSSLEEAGLVSSSQVPSGSGRPRKVFTPVPISELATGEDDPEGHDE